MKTVGVAATQTNEKYQQRFKTNARGANATEERQEKKKTTANVIVKYDINL